jgi:hypothetical protein
MTDRVIFQMWSGYREQLIERHEFYVQQAKVRLLEQFTDAAISKEADRISDESWEARGQSFNPEYDDPADGAEDAYQDGVWRYQLLNELRDSVRMNIVAGFFHGWEKTFRQWLVDEVRRWHHGEKLREQIWRASFDELFELTESYGWSLKSSPWFTSFDACRLVVNVHKHGDGSSLKTLNKTYPQFLVHPLAGIVAEDSKFLDRKNHEHLQIKDTDLDDFANAITSFWHEVPDSVLRSQFPSPPTWFVKAINRDTKTK